MKLLSEIKSFIRDHTFSEFSIRRGSFFDREKNMATFLEWIKPFVDSGSGNRDMYAITIYEGQSEPTIYYLYDAD